MSEIQVDTAALAAAAGQLDELGARVGAATLSAEPVLRELAWAYPGAGSADAAGDVGRALRQALDDLQVALLTFADGMSRAATGYADVELAATTSAQGGGGNGGPR